MSETTAERLPRLGTYEVEDAAGSNGTGLAIPGHALAAYWREIVEACTGQRDRRSAAAKEVDAALARRDGAEAASIMQWRYGQKIEIKSVEAVIELVHRAVAPDAPFLCDERCAHVARGATGVQVKRILDALDATVARLRERWRRCPSGHPCFEDLQDELGIYERWRKRLVERAVPAPAPGDAAAPHG